MTYDPNKQVYAVGSQSHVSLMDRDLKPVFNIESIHKGYGMFSKVFFPSESLASEFCCYS